jgi:putative transposase
VPGLEARRRRIELFRFPFPSGILLFATGECSREYSMNRSLLLIAAWIGRALALQISRIRRPLSAEIASLHERLEKLRAENSLLRFRLERMDPRKRPRFEPWERLSILWHRARYAMSLKATAKAFVITPQTVLNWMKDVERSVSRLARARRPLNALPDLVGEIARRLKVEWPNWGTRRIAGVLARLGLKGSRSTVQRLLRRPPPPRRPGPVSRMGRPIVARKPGHVFVIDFTTLTQGFFRRVVVGAVLDLYSRKILALDVASGEPDAGFSAGLLERAIRAHGTPCWVVSDHGTQFTSARFASFLRRRRIRRRYGEIGKPGAPALDRWFRTLKDEFARELFLFRPLAGLRRDLVSYVRWYNTERPHCSLGYRTPQEAFRGRRLRRVRHAERARLEVRLLGGDRRLPVLRLRPAA